MTSDTTISRIVDLDVYQEEAFKTAIFPAEVGLLYCVMGILGEAGEMAHVMLDVIKRACNENPEFETEDLQEIRGKIEEAIDACAAIEQMKKAVRKGRYNLKPMPELTVAERGRIRSEGGDGLWYAGGMARMAGWKLSEVAQENIRKLRERQAAGVIASAGETIKERKAAAGN